MSAVPGFLQMHGGYEIDGRKLLRMMVTRNLTETFALMLDVDTYFIVLRVEQRVTAGGRRRQIVTRYDDFRPVDGVLHERGEHLHDCRSADRLDAPRQLNKRGRRRLLGRGHRLSAGV